MSSRFPAWGWSSLWTGWPSTCLDGRSSGTASSSPPGCCWQSTLLPVAPRFGIVPDHILDLMFFAVPAALVAVRAYYVIFNLDLYRRGDGSRGAGGHSAYSDGGLAIYGAIISSVIVLLIFCKVRKSASWPSPTWECTACSSASSSAGGAIL
mgnify:CR=1 FL=1